MGGLPSVQTNQPKGVKTVGLTRTQTILGILFVVLAWGSMWPINKIALQYSPPILYAAFRALLGGILLTVILIPLWRHLHWKSTWPIYTVAAAFNIVLFFLGQSFGLPHLPAGLFSVIVYFQPVLVALMAWLWLNESLTVRKITGILIGFSGIVFISLEGLSGEISAVGILWAIITGTAWAIGTVYVKKMNGKFHGLWIVAMQNLIGGVFMTVLGVSVEDAGLIEWNFTYIASLFYSSIFAMSGAYAVYYKLISSGEASKMSSYTFLAPLFAILIGTAFLSEPFTLSLFAGMVLILSGIFLINWENNKLSA